MVEISIIIPVYDEQGLLSFSINSILRQSFDDFEAIFIYRESSDYTLEILESYSDIDDRVKVITPNNDTTVAEALNIGLDYSSGKYACRHDADDIMLPNRLLYQYSLMEHDKDIFMSGNPVKSSMLLNLRAGSIKKWDQNNCEEWGKDLHEKSILLWHPTIMFRNDGFRYREKFKTMEEVDFELRAISNRQGRLESVCLPLIIKIYTGNNTPERINNTMVYARKARMFHRERVRSGYDTYEHWESPELDVNW